MAHIAREQIVSLNTALRAAGFGWIIGEVSALVERGVQEEKEVHFEAFDSPTSRTKGRRHSIKANDSRPLTEDEELSLLINAIRNVIVDTHEMRVFALRELATEGLPDPIVSFYPDVPEEFEEKGYSKSDGSIHEPLIMSLSDQQALDNSISELLSLLTRARTSDAI